MQVKVEELAAFRFYGPYKPNWKMVWSHAKANNKGDTMNAGSWVAFLSLSAAVVPAPAFADDQVYVQCMDASGGVTAAMFDCIGAAYVRLDDALHAQWEETLSSHDERVGMVLRKAQRDWSAYRKTTCEAEATLWGNGSFTAVTFADCRLRITQDRLDWLKDSQQGDTRPGETSSH